MKKQIEQLNKNTFLVKLKDGRYKSQILESIQYLSFIPKVTTNNRRDEFQIYASSVQTINDWFKSTKRMPYDIAVKLMECLYQQQQLLLKKGFSFYTFNTEDILIINDSEFICINSKHICLLGNQNSVENVVLVLSTTYSKEDFCSPELQQCNRIPNNSIKQKSSFYYTFASLIFYCFFGELLSYNNKEVLLNTIIYTPLYWFFQKGLQVDPKERKCFFIS